jgi:hypothetical protein
MSGPLTISYAFPSIFFTENDQTSPAGRWAIIIDGDNFSFRHNTAVAGDFTTYVTPLNITAANNASFIGTVTAPTFIGALTGAASSNVLKAGDTMTGALTLTPGAGTPLLLNATGSANGAIGAQTSGSFRWVFGKNNGTETGSNAGSDFVVQRYADAGTLIDQPLGINRATGLTTLTSLTVSGTLTATLTGNASTATTLQTARNINGVSFNGSADITVTAAAGTLSGATLAAGVTASSLTSVGTLTSLAVGPVTIEGTTQLDTVSTAVTTNTATTIASFATASYRSAKFLVQVTDSTNSFYHAVEITVIHNGTTVFKTEYGEVSTNGPLGTFDASITTGTLSLQFTATAATTKAVKVYQTLMAV